ncbi:MAG: 30S ribosomal protein S16 [Legionellales bacterium]|nr:30S ribosomal protein S16 [Legionellales bacterium]|tara:strand:- start:209 stop:478 length:270 start_codon:yes stop_codon:yes gene_type:complete
MERIRLQRFGRCHQPFYAIVVANKKSKRDGKCIERLGYYNPFAAGSEKTINLNIERYQYWFEKGAQPSDKAKYLFKLAKKTLRTENESQ